MNNKSFSYSLITIIIYEILNQLLHPVGFSFLKILITLFIWISFYFSIRTFINHYQTIRNNISGFPLLIFIILILWNIISIIQSSLDEDFSYATLLGNSFTSLALLVPFSLAFGVYTINLRVIGKFLVRIIAIGISAFIIFLPFADESDFKIFYSLFFKLLYCTVFLIPFLPFQSGKNKYLVILGSIILFYLAYKVENRTMFIRIALLYASLLIIYLFRLSNSKLLLIITLASLIIPFYFIKISLDKSKSAIEEILSLSNNQRLTTDTRTFIYVEVFSDLKFNNRLLVGKGSCGKYFSPYFSEEAGDSPFRLSVEVGILALLLKGGFIAVFLNFILLFMAIYSAFFKSNNKLLIGLGLMLLIHTQILFVENFIDYSLYNLLIWFFIGVCLSKDIRSLSDEEIVEKLRYL